MQIYKFNAFLIQGKKLYNEKKYERATVFFKWALNLDPNNREIYLYRGLTEFALKKQDEALLSLQACFNTTGTLSDTDEALANLYMGFCQPTQQERLNWIIKATVADSGCHLAWFVLSQHYMHELKHIEMNTTRAIQTARIAIVFSQNACTTDPGNPAHIEAIGTTYLLAAKKFIPLQKDKPGLKTAIAKCFQNALLNFKNADTLSQASTPDRKALPSDHYVSCLKEYADFLASIKMDLLAQEYFELHAKFSIKYSDIAKRNLGLNNPKIPSKAPSPTSKNNFFKTHETAKPKKAKSTRAWNIINQNN